MYENAIGLKNSQAEFQQIVNEIFGDLIGKNMEVYVDVIILKIKESDMLPNDMRETFIKIQQVGTWLNLKKYVFSVPTGK